MVSSERLREVPILSLWPSTPPHANLGCWGRSSRVLRKPLGTQAIRGSAAKGGWIPLFHPASPLQTNLRWYIPQTVDQFWLQSALKYRTVGLRQGSSQKTIDKNREWKPHRRATRQPFARCDGRP